MQNECNTVAEVERIEHVARFDTEPEPPRDPNVVTCDYCLDR